ncbi:hypothetical protein K474DRAFT_232529 [Panus rudis PR-1116 ss-1]|nr:hypothetical protein K474DRAFT_232529 [Panus rudis PR-1116 ss-1]
MASSNDPNSTSAEIADEPKVENKSTETQETPEDGEKIALYISSDAVTPEIQAEIQHIFDTYPCLGITPDPGYIKQVPASDWAKGLKPLEIYDEHGRDHPVFRPSPIVILDERTAKDKSVVIVDEDWGEEEDEDGNQKLVPKSLRCVPEWVQMVVVNLSIGNQNLWEFAQHNQADGVFHGFPETESKPESETSPADT